MRGSALKSAPLGAVTRKRCAIYTRTSSDERLSQDFNSLDAQREACAAYVASQRHEGWVAVDDCYDDGGHSGGSLERPALKRLLDDIARGRVDIVVTYKIDRLSRSMRDFMNLVDLFDQHQVTCVSITQNFSTTTSMGRLTLNMLLSFAQFERELGRERTKDKIAASRAKGIWMGGTAPIGYRVENRKLVIHEAEAALIRTTFQHFAAGWTTRQLLADLAGAGLRTKAGNLADKTLLARMLRNRAYLGLAVHKNTAYPGEHEAIISQGLWDKVQARFTVPPRRRANNARATTPALLKGLIFTTNGHAMSPSHTRRKGKLYRYYVSQAVLKHGAGHCPIGRVAAGDIEPLVLKEIQSLLQAPDVIVGVWAAAQGQDGELAEAEVRAALQDLAPLWNELYPAEQARIAELLISRIEVGTDAVEIVLRSDGLGGLLERLRPQDRRQAA